MRPMALWRLWSKSTKVSAGQSWLLSSLRVTRLPASCSNIASSWLALQTQLDAAFAQFARTQIQFKSVESQHAHRWGQCGHSNFRKFAKTYHNSCSAESSLRGLRSPCFSLG